MHAPEGTAQQPEQVDQPRIGQKHHKHEQHQQNDDLGTGHIKQPDQRPGDQRTEHTTPLQVLPLPEQGTHTVHQSVPFDLSVKENLDNGAAENHQSNPPECLAGYGLVGALHANEDRRIHQDQGDKGGRHPEQSEHGGM